MSGPVLILGSAPVSQELSDRKLPRFQKVAINKSWRLRKDFDYHVFLKSLPEKDMPTGKSGMKGVDQTRFREALRAAGGLYVCSGSVAMIAGYWALPNLAPKVVCYYGCDLVFSPDAHGRTHYYEGGDTGPLVGNFQYNLRQQERSIRLMCWGLFNNAVFLNASGLEGSLLAFPKVTLDQAGNAILAKVRKMKSAQNLMKASAEVFAFEMATRTEKFEAKQRIFEENEEALNALSQILDKWQGLMPQVEEFCLEVEQYT